MKKLFFLLSVFMTLASPGIALDSPPLKQKEVLPAVAQPVLSTIDPPQLTQAEILLAGAQAIVGTIVGTGNVHKDPDSFLYGTLKIRVDEVIGANKLGLKVGQVISDEVSIFDAAFDANRYGVKIPPEVIAFESGSIGFDSKSRNPTDEEFHAAVFGKQFVISLSTHTIPDGVPTTVWPLWSRDWVRSCWTGGPCDSSPFPPGASGQDVLGCVAEVLSRQPNLSAVHASLAGYVQFDFLVRNNLTESGLVWAYRQHGLFLMGAPLLDLMDARLLKTAPILDEKGAAIVGRNDDGNPLKAAIPVIADECHLPYAGD